MKQLAERHPGLDAGYARHIAAAAAVCLARFHDLPPTRLMVRWNDSRARRFELIWEYPSDRQRATNMHEIDATEDGAYAVVLGSVDGRLGYVTIGRTEARSHSDWYLVPASSDTPDLFDLDRDDLERIEISGVSDDDDGKLRDRIREKLAQARGGDPAIPAMVGVVGFRTARVVLKRV